MKATQVQAVLSLYQGTAKRTENIATELRNVGLLPKGGRGPYAPDVTAEDAARLAIAVASSERVADASSNVERLSATIGLDGKSLIETLAEALLSDALAYGIKSVRLYANFPMAEVTFRSGTISYYFLPGVRKEGFDEAGQGAAYVGQIGHIGGAILHQLAIDFGDADEEGEFVG